LLAIGAHDDAGQPAQNAADDQNDDDIHVISPFQSAGENIAQAIWFRFCLIPAQPVNLEAVQRNQAASSVVTYAELGSGPLKSTLAASRRPSDLAHTVHCRVGKLELRTTKSCACRLALNNMASNREGGFKWS
jgi:hypothetical protein